MWALTLIMAYISLIIGRRGFGGKADLWAIICPESYGGVTFDLGPLLQGRMWALIPIMAKSCVPNLLVMSDLTLEPSLKVKCGPTTYGKSCDPNFCVGLDLTFNPSFKVERGP